MSFKKGDVFVCSENYYFDSETGQIYKRQKDNPEYWGEFAHIADCSADDLKYMGLLPKNYPEGSFDG